MNFAIQILEHGNWNFQACALNVQRAKVAQAFANPQVRRNDLNALIEASAQDCVEILINGGAQDGAAILLVIRGKVSAAAPETNPYWAANDEHLTLNPAKVPVFSNPFRKLAGWGHERTNAWRVSRWFAAG